MALKQRQNRRTACSAGCSKQEPKSLRICSKAQGIECAALSIWMVAKEAFAQYICLGMFPRSGFPSPVLLVTG